MDKNNCSCNCNDIMLDEYEDIIEQLKETRDSIDKMIHTLEHRKVKDDIINHILNTEYEDESAEDEDDDDILDALNLTLQSAPFNSNTRIYYPYRRKYYPFFY